MRPPEEAVNELVRQWLEKAQLDFDVAQTVRDAVLSALADHS